MMSTKTQPSDDTVPQSRQVGNRAQQGQKTYLIQSMTEGKNSTIISPGVSGLHYKKISLVTKVGEEQIRTQKRLYHNCLNNHLDLTKKHTMRFHEKSGRLYINLMLQS